MFKVPAATTPGEELDRFMAGLKRRNPGEPEFHQAVEEVSKDIIPFITITRSTGMPIFLSA